MTGAYPLYTTLNQRHNIVAIGISAFVHFYHHSGRFFHYLCIDESTEKYVTSIEWHPARPFLVIGNNIGEIEIWEVSLSPPTPSPRQPEQESDEEFADPTTEKSAENRRIVTTRDKQVSVTMFKFNASGE